MKFEFSYTTKSGYEGTVSFFGETEAAARERANDWATNEITIGNCVATWTVE